MTIVRNFYYDIINAIKEIELLRFYLMHLFIESA